MTTLVSGFIDRSRYDPVRPSRPVEFYLEHGKALLALDVPKVIFLEPHVIALLEETIKASPHTTVVPFTKEEMEYWPSRNRFLACPPPPGGSPSKDTHDFMIVMLNKVSWCIQAEALNPYTTELFAWVDFGINYILKEVSLNDAVTHLVAPGRVRPGTLRIPGCKHFFPPYHPAQLVWKYCGGLFCGDVATLKRMQADQRTVVVHLLDANLVTWEVTVWYYMQAPYMDRYIANHDATMFTQF